MKKFFALALALILVLAVHSVLLSGAAEGISFYLVPSIEKVKSVGITNVVTEEIGRAHV